MFPDRLLVQERLGDRVQAVEETMPILLGNLEGDNDIPLVLGVYCDGQGVEVDAQIPPLGVSAGVGHDLPLLLGEFDGKKAVVEGIPLENVGEAFTFSGSDQGAKSSLLDGPNGVFPARSATKISTRDENARASEFGGVERKIGSESP